MEKQIKVFITDIKSGQGKELKVKTNDAFSWAEERANKVGGVLEFSPGKITFSSKRKFYTVYTS